MKKQTSEGSQNPESKIIGAIPLHINADTAAGLVAGIVEKGFSDLSQNRTSAPPVAPRPSVLPFPVARHRSYGPKWAPNAIDDDDGDALDWDAGDDEGSDRMEQPAGFAYPVQRKEKKGLDFNKWKDMLKTNGESMLHVPNGKEKQQSSSAFHYKTAEKTTDNSFRRISESDDSMLFRTPDVTRFNRQIMAVNENISAVRKMEERSDGISIDDSQEPANSRNATNVDIVKPLQGPPDYLSVSGELAIVMNDPLSVNLLESENISVGGELSLQDQIEAENSDRLAKMSTEEIASEQAEIMAKLSPELINALRKRGKTKAQKLKSSFSRVSGSQADNMRFEEKSTGYHANSRRNEKCISKLNPGSVTIRDVPEKLVSGDELEDEDKVSSGKSPENSSMWDVWNERVERVRNWRFSLDGKITRRNSAYGSDSTPSGTGCIAENVSKRDFLRTEGDPAAGGYSVKEAVALTRSLVPGQRALALHLISAILDLATRSILRNPVSSDSDVSGVEDYVDGEAIWAFCLGPEPELALSLRMCLDDNHKSVVLACAKAIHCALSCDMNDIIFDIMERTPSFRNRPCTAPVFRRKPNLSVGFFHGGFWKYNTKPSNILPLDVDDEFEGQSERTIQDDIVAAGQDFAAGLVRMGILSRINYLLETDPAAPLEEYLISILISIARHSPTCAAAVMASGNLIQTVATRFASTQEMEINSCKIKTVVLIKVLAQLERKNCLIFLKNGIFRQVMWQLYRYHSSLVQWLKYGSDACKLSYALLVEQLRLWKVFILYGFCISDFSDLFPSLCLWLALPTVEKLGNYDLMIAYFAITREVYLLLDVIAREHPNIFFHDHELSQYDDEDRKAWSWCDVGPVIDSAIEWIKLKSIPHLLRPLDSQNLNGPCCDVSYSDVNSVIWVISSVLRMLTALLKALTGDSAENFLNGHFPWLPEFVTKIGLAVAGTGVLSFSGLGDAVCNDKTFEAGNIAEYFYLSRFNGREEWAISATCCLQGMVQVAASVDNIIRHSNLRISENNRCIEADKILASGILRSFRGEVRYLLSSLMNLINSYWHSVQNIDVFGRGGPSPGVGVGWGASGGGYWSLNTLLAQQDAKLLCYLLEIPELQIEEESSEAGEKEYTLQVLYGVLGTCLIVYPGNSHLVDLFLKFIFQVPALKYLGIGIHHFLLSKGRSPFLWNYEEDEYRLIASVLIAHYRERWLGVKKKQKAVEQKDIKKGCISLETIQEHDDFPESFSLTVEWASQRLPLPTHWFLTSMCSESSPGDCVAWDSVEVAKAGLFFLLGIEAIPTCVRCFEFPSPVKSVPVVWKLHAMSVVLLSVTKILSDEKSRDVYARLQDVYGELVDEERSQKLHGGTSVLGFQSEIHESYSEFVDKLVEQFAAESYGDILFGRQMAIYLHRSVEASVRLAAWKALHSSRALELVPPLANCFANAEGYLEPIEDEERILDAYGKSWVCGALDKSESRCSLTFVLALHHLSSYIFGNGTGTFRDQLVKSLLRDYSRKQHHEGMMMKLICYAKSNSQGVASITEVERRLQLLNEICKGSTDAVEKLEYRIRSQPSLSDFVIKF